MINQHANEAEPASVQERVSGSGSYTGSVAFMSKSNRKPAL